MAGPVPRGLDEARAELIAITARAAELRAYVEAETLRRRRTAYALRYDPCDWCGSSECTVADAPRGIPTGRFVCRWLGPCRIAWMIGIGPEEFRERERRRRADKP